MCGIVGFSTKKDPKSLLWLEASMRKMHHRGPDGKSWVLDESPGRGIPNVGFGHVRLAINDLSKNGVQPMTTQNYWLTFNGEIYNYLELRSYLYSSDDLGKTTYGNDALTLVQYIEKFGLTNALLNSNGMFAFALYDEQMDVINLCVDRFAQKPLYYYHAGDKFYFASSPNVLYDLKGKWRLDKDALETYWMLGGVIGENQLFEGIKKVCAGEIVTFDRKTNQVYKTKYYEPKPRKVDLEYIIYDAIEKVKVSDVPVNIFLSGGIDSTLVASRFKGATAIHLRSNEIEYAQFVAEKYNQNLIIVDPEEESIENILTDYVTKSGEPTMAGAIPWITAKYASKYGKVAVIANGADECFFGYDRLIGDNQEASNLQDTHMFRSVFDKEKKKKHRKNFNNKPSSRLTDLLNFVQFDVNRTLDFASMCHSLEVRSPFLDHRLVETALSIDETEHRKSGNKTLLKQILWGLGFDKKFTDRPKQGFSLVFNPKEKEYFTNLAMKYAINEGYLRINKVLSGRDKSYIENAALGFYFWHKTYKTYEY